MKHNPIHYLIVILLVIGLFFSLDFFSNNFSEKEKFYIRSSTPLGYTFHIDGNWSATQYIKGSN